MQDVEPRKIVDKYAKELSVYWQLVTNLPAPDKSIRDILAEMYQELEGKRRTVTAP